MSAFDGSMIMYDGATLEIIWRREYTCHETYTSPAPGFFNDDDIPDFIFAQNFGAFDIYQYSILNILDGKTGSILWEQRAPRMQMISPLTIQTTQKNPPRDIYFYRIQGIEANNIGNISQQVYHGLEPQQPIDKLQKPKRNRKHRHKSNKNPFEDISIKRENQCPEFEVLDNKLHELFKPKCEINELNSAFLNTYGLLIDRSIEENPLIVFKSGPKIVQYNYTLEDFKKLSNIGNITFESNDFGSTCIILEPMERNTGAITDVDGDGIMDIITIIAKDGIVKNIDNSYLKVIVEIEIIKKSLNNVFKKQEKLKNNIFVKAKSKAENVEIQDLEHSRKQSWNSYMGKLKYIQMLVCKLSYLFILGYLADSTYY